MIACSHIIDAQGAPRIIHISVLVVPGLGWSLFSVEQASRKDVVSILDVHNPKLEANNFTGLLEKLENDLDFFSLGLSGRSGARELAMQAGATATLGIGGWGTSTARVLISRRRWITTE